MSVRSASSTIFRLRNHFVVDVAVAGLVLALPLGLHGTTSAASPGDRLVAVAASTGADAPRASTVSRGATISAVNDPSTALAEDVRPIVHYTLGPSDELTKIANFFHVSPEAIAFSNGISDPDLRAQKGREILIPPGDGALYTVKDGDTVDSVATRFKVAPAAIMGYNRLYFEPEHFAPGQLVYVPGATVPGLKFIAADDSAVPPPVAPNSARIAPSTPNNAGRLAWPVAGIVSQYFWAYHTGVDIAAPYGSGIGASQEGTVVSTGWVAVGGLSVRIQHANGLETGYYHMGSIFVAPGTKVQKGQIIGTIGMTGVTTGPHVHWELKSNGAFVNPLLY
jgi:murein DD-endopeptidase MepM/ murein hydrolase activator NlpD